MSGQISGRSHSTSGWSGRGGQTRNPYVARSQSVRFELGYRRRHQCQPRHGGSGYRDRRVGGVSRDGQWPGGAQADRRAGEPFRHHPDFGQPGYRGPDDAHRARRGRPSQRDDRHRSGRWRDRESTRRWRRRFHHLPFVGRTGRRTARGNATLLRRTARARPADGGLTPRIARCRRRTGGPGRHHHGAEARSTGIRGAPV